jgi:hypothetical protein
MVDADDIAAGNPWAIPRSRCILLAHHRSFGMNGTLAAVTRAQEVYEMMVRRIWWIDTYKAGGS